VPVRREGGVINLVDAAQATVSVLPSVGNLAFSMK
jgi:hypothetical protein